MKILNDPFWQRLIQQAEGLLSVSSNCISNVANLSALLFQELADISWVGSYGAGAGIRIFSCLKCLFAGSGVKVHRCLHRV